MACRSRLAFAGSVLAVLAVAAPSAAPAAFHLMQIEQALGGLCGDTALQAVQLRMRFAGQNLVAGHHLAVYDANGENRALLLVFPAHVSNGAAGDRILVATAGFAAATGLAPDFVLAQPIPVSRLRAGRLTFEDSPGAVLWALAWGGARYLGDNAGLTTNDADGDFGPPVAKPLPTSAARTLRFPGAANAVSTTNAADYVLTVGAATLTNNAGASVVLPPCLFGERFELGDAFDWSDLLGVELCNGIDDDGDGTTDEDFPLGQTCPLPGGATGTLACAPDTRGVLCV